MKLRLSELKKLFSFSLILILLSITMSCRKKPAAENPESQGSQEKEVEETEEDSEEKKFIALFDFYSPAFDKGDWVEEVLARVEEERIAEQLAAMEESLDEMNEAEEVSDFAEDSEETEPEAEKEAELSDVEKFFQEEKSGSVLHGKNNELKFYEFDNEIFAPQYTDGKLVSIHANGNSVDRLFYDDQYLLIKKESWNIPSVQGAVLEKTENYDYHANSSIISKKSITAQNTFEKIAYSKTSKILTYEKSYLADEKKTSLLQRKFKYDKDDRLISDEMTEYYYKDKEYKELDYTFIKKYTYIYNEGEIPADFKYYENGQLKMYNKYSTEKGKYVSEIFFDKNFSVKTYYENDVRVKDVFYSGGKITREKLYDKMD